MNVNNTMDTRDRYRDLNKDIVGLIIHMKQFDEEVDHNTYSLALQALERLRVDITNRRDYG